MRVVGGRVWRREEKNEGGGEKSFGKSQSVARHGTPAHGGGGALSVPYLIAPGVHLSHITAAPATHSIGVQCECIQAVEEAEMIIVVNLFLVMFLSNKSRQKY